MAYKDSEEIKANESYALGDYSFRIERSSVPGSTNDKIEAICTQGGKNARKSIQVPSSTQLDGWYVEANGTEATVYAVEKIPKGGGEGEYTSELDTTPMTQPIPAGTVMCVHENNISRITTAWAGAIAVLFAYDNGYRALFASSSPVTVISTVTSYNKSSGRTEVNHASETLINSYTHNGKTVYYVNRRGSYSGWPLISSSPENPNGSLNGSNEARVAWTIIYGETTDPEYEEKTVLVGRFSIDIEDAGGVGPGSDWVDPGDYDPDWEPDDPTHTLYVEVTGALSGRHNDPIEDPSYSYIPADKDTVKDYGCGGDGGHGGGGGAGASTVVIHKFATNQANNKEVTAIARRHGYGSGGGKGGKGGDGCILVYY